MAKSTWKPDPLRFTKDAAKLGRVYNRRNQPTIRSVARSIIAPFNGKLGIPAWLAGAGFLGALALALADVDPRWVQSLLAIAGVASVFAVTAAVARLRIERSLYGLRLEENVRRSLSTAAGALHGDDRLLHGGVAVINDRLVTTMAESKRLAEDAIRSMEDRLVEAEKDRSRLEAEIADLHSRRDELVGALEAQINDADQRIKMLETSSLTKERFAEEKAEVEDRLAKHTADSIRSELAHRLKTIHSANASTYQPFSRYLSSEDINYLTTEWAPAMRVDTTAKEVAYLAHRVGALEESALGRLAASAPRILTRILTARAAQAHATEHNESLRILEIGTLFGIGLAALYEASHDRGLGVEVTAVDPLEGYYGPGVPDLVTRVPINRSVFEENMNRAHVPVDCWRLVQDFSGPALPALAAEGSSYHLIVIDGDHSYEGVKVDFEGSLPLAELGAYLIFDDYDVPEWPDIKRFVDEEVQRRTDLELIAAGFGSAVYRVISK